LFNLITQEDKNTLLTKGPESIIVLTVNITCAKDNLDFLTYMVTPDTIAAIVAFASAIALWAAYRAVMHKRVAQRKKYDRRFGAMKIFDRKVFESIQSYWKADQDHPHRHRQKKDVPTVDDFATLVEISFRVSIKQEEGISNKFSVALLSRKDLDEGKDLFEIIYFSEPVSFDSDYLLKLSSASDPRINSIIVTPYVKEGRTGYEIVGMLFFSKSHMPVHHEFSKRRPDALIVTAIAPGLLIIGRGDSQIGRFDVGHFTPSTPSPFSSKAMGNYIINTISNNKGYQEHKSIYWQQFSRALKYLLLETASRSHGATIVVMPENKINECTKFFKSKYLLTAKLNIGDILIKIMPSPYSGVNSGGNGLIESYLDEAYQQALEERLDFVAQLACIDGALILSDCLEPITFGATLSMTELSKKVVVGPDGFGSGGMEFDISLRGKRHNSAASFINNCPSCCAFVISEDGPIRGFVKGVDDAVLCWPDMSVSMFIKDSFS
jgi:hypothetical protein